MDAALVATKLRIPPRTRHLVDRPRLVHDLERNVARYKLTVVATPAGYGKTTLLAQWARASRLPVAWLSISTEDNDLERFFRYLVTAWRDVQPSVGASAVSVLLGATSPDPHAVLSAFINVASEMLDHTVFVLDDFHLIEDPSILEAMTFLLDHLPPTLHFVLAGRGEPPLPLARYRTRDELRELSQDDLHFSVSDAEEFLNQRMELALTADEIVALQSQTEGWIAGLQLASLAVRRQGEADLATLNLSGRHRFIADFLDADVVGQLSEDRRRFLCQTSVLDRLCGSLCNAVTGRDDSQELLERLEQENLFLVPLDDQREWFRYHRLFAGFLQEQLRRLYPDDIAHLHHRAAAWYLARDLPEAAFQHAVAGDHLHLGVRIVDRYANAMLQSGEYRDMQRWLDTIPAAWYAAHPALALSRAGLLAFTGSFEACQRCVDEVEQRLVQVETADARWQRAKVSAIRCAIACMQNDLPRAEALAGEALRELPAEDLGYRPLVYGALGDSYRENGRWDEAKQSYLNVLTFVDAPMVRVEAAHVYGALADLDLRQGRLRGAAGNWQKALAAVHARENWGRVPLPVIGWIYLRFGELLYERNDLAGAWDHVARGLDRAELGGDVRAKIAGHLLASRMKLTAGDIAAAEEYLDLARPLVEAAPFADWTSRRDRCQLDLWLARDRLRAAVDWATAALDRGIDDNQPNRDGSILNVAYVLIVKGDTMSRRQALDLLDPVLRAALAEGRMGVQIDALTLQAMAWWRDGDRARAMICIEGALRLAEPEGYVRRFIDFGQPAIQLLHEARRRTVLPGYVAHLLAAAGASTDGAMLTEPLSDRERAVLNLMAAGLTNREIAGALGISAETVKKHTGSIYGKLGAANRTEAAAIARQLDLLTG